MFPPEVPFLSKTPQENSEKLEISVRSRKKGLRWFWWLMFLALLTFGGWRVFQSLTRVSKEAARSALEKAAPIPVILAAASIQDFPIYLDGLGTVQAFNSVQVNARVAGQIAEMKFQEGEDVKAGDLLAVIDPRVFQAQYDQAVARKQQDEAQLQSVRVLLERDEQLLIKSVLDHQTYDTQKYLVAQMAATVQADVANMELQKAELDYTQVVAPIAGRTGVRQLDVGNQVSLGGNGTNNASTIVVINQIQPIYVSFTLPQQDLSQIREPLLAHKKLEVIALDRNNQTILSRGSLSVIDNQIDVTTATIRLKAVFTNEDYKLWPGQFVNVRLLLGERPRCVVVPSEAIQLGPDGSYVYAVVEGKAKMRPVVTGPSEGGMTLVESGLKNGEMIVTDGQYRLQVDSPVKISPPINSDAQGKHPVKSS
jgi:multidrug efflux system membrane fusion protein